MRVLRGVVLGLVLPLAVTQAGGFDGTAVTLVDNTSVRVKLNVPHDELTEAIRAGHFEPPGILAGEPGLRVTYFDEDLLLSLPVEPGHEVEIAGVGKLRVMVAVVLFPEPGGFGKRWPLVGNPDPGVYYLVAHHRVGRPGAALVTARPPHRATPVPVRLPDYGATPGAMMGPGEVHPYVTQIGKGCTFGVGLVTAERNLACDLVR